MTASIRFELAALLCAKLVLLAALYVLFFGPGHRAPQTPSATAAHVMEAR